ncbi:MAG: FHA domain-containing protein [Proteobacteria bacterium]|nr:FHA domain-containing protein [Pseudomonadota bacterium]
MSALVVDVVFRDRVLETVPFDRPTLRVGRMPENDLVIDNLAVSRFHARLHLDERRVFLEDAGSENGCLVNGERLAGRREIAPGDRIAIGKHELRVRSASEDDAPGRKPGRHNSDGFDGARTYLVGMGGGAPPDPVALAAPPAPIPSAALEEEIIPMSEKRSASTSAPVAPAASPQRSSSGDFDFDFVGTLADEPMLATELPEEATPESPVYAGFIVQHQGKLERIVAWKGEQVVAGRAADCDVVLGIDEVSRRHARFERAGDRFEVCDLGSVNGTFVNGRRVERQALCADDVVQIEDFKLTFVLDRQPIEEMCAPPTAAPAPQDAGRFGMTMLQEQMPHRPGFTEILARPGPGEARAKLASDAPVEVVALPEGDLFAEDLDEVVGLAEEGEAEKPEAPVAAPLRASSRATSVQELGRVSQPNLRELVFELRVRVELLPPALREAFEAAGTSELVLPAELRIKP